MLVLDNEERTTRGVFGRVLNKGFENVRLRIFAADVIDRVTNAIKLFDLDFDNGWLGSDGDRGQFFGLGHCLCGEFRPGIAGKIQVLGDQAIETLVKLMFGFETSIVRLKRLVELAFMPFKFGLNLALKFCRFFSHFCDDGL